MRFSSAITSLQAAAPASRTVVAPSKARCWSSRACRRPGRRATLPTVGLSSPVMSLKIDDLPAPLRPMMPHRSPSATVKVTFLKSSVAPKETPTLESERRVTRNRRDEEAGRAMMRHTKAKRLLGRLGPSRSGTIVECGGPSRTFEHGLGGRDPEDAFDAPVLPGELGGKRVLRKEKYRVPQTRECAVGEEVSEEENTEAQRKQRKGREEQGKGCFQVALREVVTHGMPHVWS